MPIKKIGVLTSGGDCAGLNAALRAITHHAAGEYGWEVLGIMQGTTGLIRRPLAYVPLTVAGCDSEWLRAGGTYLGSTNKDNPLAWPMPDGTRKDRSGDFLAAYQELGLEALIAIGGDGSMMILSRLCERGGIPLVTIPKTIDNDISYTDSAIGFNTALEVATEALDRLRPTAASHQRVMVLEVMGRDAGHIALSAGIAGGADVILVPEIPYIIENVCAKINQLAAAGRNYALVIVAEAVKNCNGKPMTVEHDNHRARYGGIGHYLGCRIQEMTGAETRVTVLGHVQRGAQACARDRIIASAFGVHAVELVKQGRFGRMVTMRGRNVGDVPISDAIAAYHAVEPGDVLVRTAKSLGVYLGEV